MFLSDDWNFFSCSKSIGDTFNIEDKSDTSKHPFLGWEFGLELSGENIGVTSVFCLVDWALIDTLINLLSGGKISGSAVDDWDDREKFLWSRFFKLSNSGIPSGTFNLETKDVSTLFAWWKISLPIELFEDICLDSKLVKLLLFLSGVDLLNSCQE
jgi:hypothetical protein